MERKMQERRESLLEAQSKVSEGLKIVQEVGKIAEERGFIKCPMGRQAAGPRQPPWVKSVLSGIEEGRMQDMDFYTNQW